LCIEVILALHVGAERFKELWDSPGFCVVCLFAHQRFVTCFYHRGGRREIRLSDVQPYDFLSLPLELDDLGENRHGGGPPSSRVEPLDSLRLRDQGAQYLHDEPSLHSTLLALT